MCCLRLRYGGRALQNAQAETVTTTKILSFVEVVSGSIPLKKSAHDRWSQNWRQAGRLSGGLWLRHWDQLGQFPKVLGGCCEEELVVSAVWSS
jgi:hypothetical protein